MRTFKASLYYYRPQLLIGTKHKLDLSIRLWISPVKLNAFGTTHSQFGGTPLYSLFWPIQRLCVSLWTRLSSLLWLWLDLDQLCFTVTQGYCHRHLLIAGSKSLCRSRHHSCQLQLWSTNQRWIAQQQRGLSFPVLTSECVTLSLVGLSSASAPPVYNSGMGTLRRRSPYLREARAHLRLFSKLWSHPPAQAQKLPSSADWTLWHKWASFQQSTKSHLGWAHEHTQPQW